MSALDALTSRLRAAAANPPTLGTVRIARRRALRPATDSYGRRRPVVRQGAQSAAQRRQRAIADAALDAAAQAKKALRP